MSRKIPGSTPKAAVGPSGLRVPRSTSSWNGCKSLLNVSWRGSPNVACNLLLPGRSTKDQAPALMDSPSNGRWTSVLWHVIRLTMGRPLNQSLIIEPGGESSKDKVHRSASSFEGVRTCFSYLENMNWLLIYALQFKFSMSACSLKR